MELPEDIRTDAEIAFRAARVSSVYDEQVDIIASALLAERLSATERAAKHLEGKAAEMRGSPTGNMMARIFEEQAAAIRSQP